jgi:hypothetical protein
MVFVLKRTPAFQLFGPFQTDRRLWTGSNNTLTRGVMRAAFWNPSTRPRERLSGAAHRGTA